MNALLSFKVIMHEKPGNRNDINLKFVHLGLENAGFPTGRQGGIPPTQNIALSPHVNRLFCPRNVGFVIFMQFLAILPNMLPPPLVEPCWVSLVCELEETPFDNF